jgi:hypothetical protein
MGHQSVTAAAKPYSTVRRKYDKSMYSLYNSYSSDNGGAEIRRTRSVLASPKLAVLLLLAVVLFVRCVPDSIIGKKGRLIDAPASSSSASVSSSSLSPSSWLGPFEDYHCGDRLYVLRPGGRIDTIPYRSAPSYVCPRFNYIHSIEAKK